jgi:hypothetical protein
MDERIKLLAEQADSYTKAEYEKWTPTDEFSGVPHIRNIYNKKFAELIVRETLRVTGATLSQHQTALRGFGVEE